MKHVEVALTQVGMKEDPIGSNWGSPVKYYLAAVGINFAASWCMAFVYWCVEHAGCRIPDGIGGYKNPLIHTGGVLDQWHRIDAKMKFTQPQPGDIFIQDHGHGLGHTGIIESIDGENIHTIEGNTNDTGSREGYEVCKRVRPVSSCVGFIRIPQTV